MFVGDETIARWNMVGGVSYDSFDAVRKILLKHKNDRHKNFVGIIDPHTYLRFMVEDKAKHTFHEFMELRDAVLYTIGRVLNKCPNSHEAIVVVPKWYNIWYTLIIGELHLKGFRVGIRNGGGFVDDDVTLFIGDKKYSSKNPKYNKDNEIVYMPDEEQWHRNSECYQYSTEYFDRIVVRLKKPYIKKVEKSESVAAIGITDGTNYTHSGIHLFNSKFRFGNNGKYLYAFMKRHYKIGYHKIDLDRFYMTSSISDDYREFLKKLVVVVNERALLYTEEYSDMSVYISNKFVSLDDILKSTYACYKDYFRIMEGKDSRYKNKTLSSSDIRDAENDNKVILQ